MQGIDTYVGVLGAVEGVETEVTRLAVTALEHLDNGHKPEELKEANPHEQLLHRTLLDGRVVERRHLGVACIAHGERPRRALVERAQSLASYNLSRRHTDTAGHM